MWAVNLRPIKKKYTSIRETATRNKYAIFVKFVKSWPEGQFQFASKKQNEIKWSFFAMTEIKRSTPYLLF